MAALLDKLPTILILAVLVGIFVALRRHVQSTRLWLWTFAWFLVFVHFFAELFEQIRGVTGGIFESVSWSALQLAAMFFVASLSAFQEDRRKTWTFLALTGISAIIINTAISFSLDSWPVFALCFATIFFGAPVLAMTYQRKASPAMALWTIPVFAIGAWVIYDAWHHSYDTGWVAAMTLGYGFPGLLFWKRYDRKSAGVIASACGFLFWAAVFPGGILIRHFFPDLKLNDELWNTPKYFVAFGMVLTLLEDKSDVLDAASRHEHKLNEQLQKFASITSRLLTGTEVNSLCNEIAQAITETSTFQRASILLSTDDGSLYVAGHSGFIEEDVVELKSEAALLKVTDIADACQLATKLGQNSFLLRSKDAHHYCSIPSRAEFPPNSNWQKGDKMIVPLPSTRGAPVGCLALDDPRDTNRVGEQEMSKIELLSGDLAVTIGNTALHRQLVRSEKLAAIGQLVAGVAHELNNPLASIVGYSELLGDEIPPGPSQQKLEKLVREARRMKKIIENLLRFARHSNLEKKSASLPGLLQDVISLREYHIRSLNIEVQVKIEQDLPHIALDEDQFKQILLNLLNNSIDALEHSSPKRIRVEANRQGERVAIRFEDSGPGFTDLNRVFDPFYTTKPVGKGTGLGLSICYGIVKEHGGDVYAMNIEPSGARIVLELPVYSSVSLAAAAIV